MRNKGLYTGAIGFIAVAIIIATSFSMVSTVKLHQQESYANNIMETKWQMQNTKHMASKIVSDAMADSGSNNGCTFVINDIIDTLGDGGSDGYLKDTLKEAFSDCTVEVQSVVEGGVLPIGRHLRVRLQNISCSRDADGISINYGKQDIEFNKQITYFEDILVPGSCYIDVRDMDSGKCDVDIIGAPFIVPEDIC